MRAMLKLLAAAFLTVATAASAQSPPQPLQLNLGGTPNDRTGAPARTLFQQLQGGVNSIVTARGAPNGLAGLDATGKVPPAQLPPLSLTGGSVGSLTITGTGSLGEIGTMSMTPDNGVQRTLKARALDMVRLADYGAVYGCSSLACQNTNAAALAKAQAAMPFGGDIYLGRDQIDFPTGLTVGNTTGSAYRILGEGSTAVFINGATGNFMKLNPGSQARGFQIVHRDTRTAGMDFDVTSSNTIQDIATSGYFKFIGSTTGTKANINGLITVTGITARAPMSGTGSGLIDLPYQHAGRFTYITATGLVNVAGPDFGIHIRHGDTAEIDHVNISVHGSAVFADPGSGEFISFVTIKNSYLDSARGVPCMKLQPTPGGTILQWSISDTEIGNAGQFNGGPVQASALLDASGGGINDVDFTAVKFPGVLSTGANDPQAQAFAGLYVVGPNAQNIRVNGGSSSNAESGLRFKNVQGFSVIGHTAGPVAGVAGNKYGIYVEGASNQYVVANNILTGNTTSPFIDAATGTPLKIVSPNITP